MIDAGPGAGPETVPADPFAESGRGLTLMRALMDDIEMVCGEETGTVVHLRKQLVLNDDAPLRLWMTGKAGERGAGPR